MTEKASHFIVASQVAMKEPMRKDAVLILSKLRFQLGLSSIFQ